MKEPPQVMLDIAETILSIIEQTENRDAKKHLIASTIDDLVTIAVEGAVDGLLKDRSN